MKTKLDDANRADVVDELSAAAFFEPSNDPQYLAEWESEIGGRIEQVKRGEGKLIPWREAIEQIRPGEGDDEFPLTV